MVRGGNDCDMDAVTLNEERQKANRRLVIRLLWAVAGSILFAVSLVPLYNVFCEVTGLNGKTENVAALNSSSVDTSRMVTVEFTGNVMPGLGWNFHPKQARMQVHPGQIETATFVAKNITNEVVAGQAVPSVTPGVASAHFKKIECFCFARQELKPGESKEMPLRFYVSKDLPKDVEVVTLSYAFFSAIENADNN